ncbi:TIGR00341 family protein [Gordonia rhizosphera]|uniref:TIGR00341 family protein n=1 Tax=Gordonia rhizosphera NBRC 16068 TaxID=1108045 RepID=K6VSU6_9ACTN|nr:TIGR00341 family protein [Gordonia rhizosphera]GAB89980.1 hypothetical protein GORHZ_078_00360 [Gordonia rhizosphera NBRC 16068]
MSVLIPTSQRRTLDELTDRLDLTIGDGRAKRSGFWIMLVLSGVIAVSGIISNSTATVIGAMIIAPLSTPILGIGLGIVTGRVSLIWRSVALVVAGLVVVVFLGWVVAAILPNTTSILTNPQVTGRTSPTLMDLLAAVATGFAGAIAVCRRDVGDILPGVAIAISLVPPLGVVGVCLGSDAPSLALGAFILFASNVIAMVITAVIVLAIARYTQSDEAAEARAPRRRSTYIILAVALFVVMVPMVGNSLSSLWAQQISEATQQWLSDAGETNAEVTNVKYTGNTVNISVLAPQQLPPTDDLQKTVDDLVPGNPDVQIIHTYGGLITPN